MKTLPPWPDAIVRDGPYKVYKGHKYTVYDDGNSAETPHQTDLAEAWEARCRVAVETLKQYEIGGSLAIVGQPAREALASIGPLPPIQDVK